MISSPPKLDIQSEPASAAMFPIKGPSQRLAPLVRLHAVLLVLLAFLSPFVFLSILKNLPGYLEADHRLAPTFALTHGYHVYYPPDSGPVLSTIYGPVTVLAYLPATLAATPTNAILIGTLLTLFVFYTTTFLVIRAAAAKTWMKWWQLFGLMVGVIWLVGPVERTTAHIHADAPALVFAALAAMFAMRQPLRFNKWNAVLAAFFGVLSVFAKQNMAPLALGLVVWFALRAGWKGASIFAAATAIFSTLMLAIAGTLMGGIAALYFNCVYMPLHQPFDKTLFFPTVMQLAITSLALLLIPTARLLQAWTQSQENLREFLIVQRTPLLIVLGVLMIPASILGRMKLGGNENSMGLSLFFFVLALLAEIAALRNRSLADILSANEIKLWTLPLLIVCLIGLGSALSVSLRPSPASPIRQAFEYSRQHPGKVYFPQFPLAQLMAEGKLYHFSWGLTDRRNAGVPVSDEHFQANLPPHAEVIAITGLVPQFEADMTARQGSRIEHFEDAAQLPQFEFFAVRRPGAK
jgi:hypothetical protein